MEITEEQYQRLAPLFPVARRKLKRSNREVRNAIRYLAEQGCPGRGLPESYGNWPAVYMRWSRWKERGTLTLVFAAQPELRGNRIRSCTGGAMRGSGFRPAQGVSADIHPLRPAGSEVSGLCPVGLQL